MTRSGSAVWRTGFRVSNPSTPFPATSSCPRQGSVVIKRLMVHYVFPPFSVNETGRNAGLSRREIGHGILTERALAGMLPNEARGHPAPRLQAPLLLMAE